MNKSHFIEHRFFEIIRVLMQRYRTDEHLLKMDGRQVVFEAACSNQFPARDIEQIYIDDEAITIICNFFGLYGIDSPLPEYFNILCIGEAGRVLKSFLNMLSQRYYVLYFWAEHGFHIEYASGLNDFLSAMNAHKEYENLPSSHSRAQFEIECHRYFNDLPFYIDEKKSGWVSVHQDIFLGQGTRLGDNFILGQRVLQNGTFINMKTETRTTQSADLLLAPGRRELFYQNIKKTASPQTHWKVTINFVRPEDDKLLGQDDIRLGLDSWLNDVNTPTSTVKRSRCSSITFELQPNL